MFVKLKYNDNNNDNNNNNNNTPCETKHSIKFEWLVRKACLII